MKSYSICALGATVLMGPALAQELEVCERYPVGEASYACTCDAQTRAGSVWGTDTYTADSDICTAALHAGVITALGGDVLAVAMGGLDAYEASSANGIDSSRWGSYGASFGFDPKGPRFVVGSGAPACERFDVELESVRCSCPAGEASGSVWGSGPYTADSALCAAATHAGVMSELGGDVTVLRFAGLEAYVGSEQNGITSRDWGAYGTSIIFNGNE